jgi:lysophospholipid acyltransferase (LPLAT)-like uncharacterized protein
MYNGGGTSLLHMAVNALARVYHYLLQNTCTFHPNENLASALKSPDPVIVAVFHQDAVTTYLYLLKFGRGRRFCSISSFSKDGGVAAYVMERVGIRTVRGSSSRGGTRGLTEMAKLVKEENYSVILLCDGPRKPFGKIRPGVAMLASITGVPIYIVRSRARHHLVLQETPPKVFLPRPFSEVTAIEAGPVRIKKRCEKEALERYREELQSYADELAARVDAYFA